MPIRKSPGSKESKSGAQRVRRESRVGGGGIWGIASTYLYLHTLSHSHTYAHTLRNLLHY